jgi:hypothetical protein
MSTLGEQRVRVAFNAGGDGTVARIKTLTAELINLVAALEREPRARDIALERFEEAAMWAVKAATAPTAAAAAAPAPPA